MTFLLETIGTAGLFLMISLRRGRAGLRWLAKKDDGLLVLIKYNQMSQTEK